MEPNKVYPLAIIGGGAAGIMAATYALNNNDEVILFPGSPHDKKKSRAFWVSKIENMPGLLSFSKAIEQPNRETLSQFENSPLSKNLHLIKNRGVEKISKDGDGLFTLVDNKGESYRSEFIILTTGIMDVQPEIGGEISPIFPYANIQLVDYCLRCDGHHVYGKNTSVIGNDAGAGWVAVMLYERYNTPGMKILTNGLEPEFDEALWELINMYEIEVQTQKILEIKGNPKEKKLEGYILQDGSFVASNFSFVSMGTIVYNELAKQLGANIDARGYVVTDDNGLSSVEGLFIAGDLRAGLKKQVYTAWDSAVDAAIEVNRLLRMKRRN